MALEGRGGDDVTVMIQICKLLGFPFQNFSGD